jgi:hypothetical protein
MTSVTFVSAFIDIGSSVKSVEHRMRLFKHLADSGIPIHLFLSSTFIEEYYAIVGEAANVRVEPVELTDLETYKEIADLDYTVPISTNPSKDTAKYHIVQNAKVEFVERVRRLNETTHYAWIDFNICQMFRDIPECMEYLSKKLRLEDGLSMPGCWPLGTNFVEDKLFLSIHWRFCGSFFVGDAKSVEKFYRVYREYFRWFVETTRTLTWEVNVWHYFEVMGFLRPNWYIADHNDSIIRA